VSTGREPRRFATAGATLALLMTVAAWPPAPESAPAKPSRPGRPGGARAAATVAAPADSDTSAVAELQREAARLRPLIRAPWVVTFLEATARLPHIPTRVMLYDSSRTDFYWESEAAGLPDSARSKLITRSFDEIFYYNTRYGTPLAYARPLDLLAAAGVRSAAGLKIADFGYGAVGHLRLLASLGAETVGIEVDPLLHKLYSVPGDQGDVPAMVGRTGRVKLVHGHFPGDSEVAAAVGEGFDVFISKNTLKNGYIHPERPVDPRRLVHLGVSDTAFVANIHRILTPKGFAMIYNLCPAPAPPDKPYIPWADGRCPFPKALWEAEGFEVIAFDRNDDMAARAMGHALNWDQDEGAMDLEHDLFGIYTLVRKRGK
jgi:hypothetical protein